MKTVAQVKIESAQVEELIDEDGRAHVLLDLKMRIGTIDAATLLRRSLYNNRKGRSALRRLSRLR